MRIDWFSEQACYFQFMDEQYRILDSEKDWTALDEL